MIFNYKPLVKQVSKVCQSTYLELQRSSSVRHILTVEVTQTFVTSLVLSHLDYYNSFVWNAPTAHHKNTSALYCHSFSRPLNTLVLHHLTKLHWLPIAQRIQCKVSFMCFDVVSKTALFVRPASPVHPILFTVFLCWHLHFLDSKMKENVPRAMHFFLSVLCHMDWISVLFTLCCNKIPVQNSTQYTLLNGPLLNLF